MSTSEPDDAVRRPTQVTETLVANSALGAVPADWDADRAVTALYSTHYRSLVRLAALLLRDVATAEEVVQDSFVACTVAGAGSGTARRRCPTCGSRSSTGH